ncbi:restriction endonuclease subunit S [Pseudomonas knackmussii]|uniref:Restriction endonuclease subunit S n=1 Tax=Pseudomonas knackmussii TaxID=65741 RepID=A0ABY4KP80_9PSED|nr:restriction endonuclease subunit S [Pseudomonas knackmussii]UPQ82215.1 restriction endonuclease subunit S [Pseudomonas knackmussii]
MTGKLSSQTTLDAIAGFTNGGAWNQTEYSDEGVPVVRVTDIKKETVDLSACKFLPKSSLGKYARHTLRAGDLVICTVGSHPTQPGSVVGRAAVVPASADGALLNQNAVCIRSSSPDVDQSWLGYLGRSQDFHDYIISCARGSASQVRMAIGLLKEMPVKVPPLCVQQRIAGVLSAYDELIENSQRRIKILESMARSLYREWFVHFRFPGHANHPYVVSSLGEIPQGWEVKSLLELTKVNYGKNLPSKKLADDGAHPVYGAAKIIGRYTEYTREQRTIICGCRGSVGEMQITEPQCFVTNNSFTFDPVHSDNFFWLFHTLKERGLRDVVGGAAQPQITLEGISSVELVTPPLPLRTRYQQTVLAMFEQAWALDSQIQNLRRTRDLLLPRLLSGQINMEAL